MMVLEPILKDPVWSGGPFEVALAAAAVARYPLQEIGGSIVEELANSSCTVCLDMPRTWFGPSFCFSFQPPNSIFVYGNMTSHLSGNGKKKKYEKCTWIRFEVGKSTLCGSNHMYILCVQSEGHDGSKWNCNFNKGTGENKDWMETAWNCEMSWHPWLAGSYIEDNGSDLT